MPLEMPSDTPIELKRRPTIPTASHCALASSAMSSRCMLHGLPSYHTEAMPTCAEASKQDARGVGARARGRAVRTG